MIVADLTVTRCAECGCNFGVPGDFLECRRGDKRDFYCPNGHVMSYRESTADILRRERDKLKQDAARLEDERRIAFERALRAEGATKRLQKRVSAGVCPCCNRTFLNMQRHMKTKHPNVVSLDATKAG